MVAHRDLYSSLGSHGCNPSAFTTELTRHPNQGTCGYLITPDTELTCYPLKFVCNSNVSQKSIFMIERGIADESVRRPELTSSSS